ncbi:MAG: hypothetical protein V7647_3073 [Acidobacteriota bacterium]
MADKFEDLRTFVHVMSAGGIIAAASEMGIAKSAVSRRVSELEGRLGVTLISRSTRSFEPTRAGIEYFRRAKAILASLDELDASASSTLGWRRFRIAAPASVIIHLLPDRLRKRSRDLDGVVVSLLATREGEEDAGRSDILIGGNEVVGAMNRAFGSHALVICASPAYLEARGSPTVPGDLRGHNLIAVRCPADEWELSEPWRGPARTALITPDEESAARAAASGLGLAQLPDHVVAHALESGRLIPVLTDFAPPPHRLIASCGPSPDALTLTVMDALTER